MITPIINMALPVLNERSPLEPYMYTIFCVFYVIGLMLFLKKKEENERRVGSE